jgi:hypothetical protein
MPSEAITILSANQTENTREDEVPPVFVCPMFIKAGLNKIIVSGRINEYKQSSIHKFTCPKRIDEVPLFEIPMRNGKEKPVFNLEKSVFKDWIDDTPETLEECFDHDFENWKINAFIKDKK